MLLDRHVDLQRELGLYETETHAIIKRFVGPGSVVLDIGAGDGYEALAFAKLGARVFAFDPDHTAVERLRRNLELNPLLADRVVVREEQFPPIAVPQADFAKVDVDGAERAIIGSLLEVPAILVETHSAALESECTRFLCDHGYEATIIENARWRALYPEWRPIAHNRWLIAATSRRGAN